MKTRTDRLGEIVDSGWMEVSVSLLGVFCGFLLFYLSLTSLPHFVSHTFWCAPLRTGLSLSQMLLLLYVVMLNWLAVRFYVVPRPPFGMGWAARFMQLAVLILVGWMIYSMDYWNNMRDCRVQREPALQQLLIAGGMGQYVPPKGLEARYCGVSELGCWSRNGEIVTTDFTKRATWWDPEKEPDHIRKLTQSAPDSQLAAGLEACMEDARLMYLPRTLTHPSLDGFDFTYLREDPYGRAMVPVLINGGRGYGAIVDFSLYPRIITCLFRGADYTHFVPQQYFYFTKETERDRAEVDRLFQQYYPR